MKRNFKMAVVSMVFAMVLNAFMPTFSLFAITPTNPGEYARIEIGGGVTQFTDADGTSSTVTVMFPNGIITVSGTNLYADQNYIVYALGSATITATANENYNANLRESGELLNSTTKTYTDLKAGEFYRIDGEFTPIGGQDNNQENGIRIEFDNAVIEGNTVTYNVDDQDVTMEVLGANISNNEIEIQANDINNISFTLGNTFNNDTMQLVVRGANSYTDILNVENNIASFEGLSLPSGGIHLALERKNNGDGSHDDEHFDGFNGEAYFVWMSGDKICYHKVTGLTGQKEDHTGYDMNYVNVDELVDESGNNGIYTWGQDDANWVLASDMEDESHNVREDISKEYIFGTEDEFDMGVQLNPTNAEDGKNSICSNGDMNFRVTIFRDNYQAIKFGTNTSDYEYFPSFWDQTFFTSTVDISGTTKEKPAVYQTYLLEPTISFEVGDNSKSDTITKVEALDVNENAVEINKVDGKYVIKFNSNYYDNVVFKITTGDNRSHYVMIARVSLNVMDNFGPNTEESKLIAQLFYPRTANFDDYEVIATIISKDGSQKVETLTADNNLNLDGGKGLYLSYYPVDVDKEDVIGAYFTVVKKGALTGKTYGGTFSGSGKGVYYDLEDSSSDTFRKMVYNK